MNHRNRLRFLIAILLASVCSAFGQVAGPPSLIDYQGELLNNLGGPITSTGGPGTTGTATNYEVRFRIWDAQTAGNLIWAEKQIVTVTADGLFSVRLGEGEALGSADGDPNPLVGSIPHGPDSLLAAFQSKERFLGLTVMQPPATPGEIQPRLAFLTSPYAAVAETARFAEFGPTGSSFSAEAIGVNTSPETTFHVSGKTYLDGGVGAPESGRFGGDGTRLVLTEGTGGGTPYGMGISPSTLWYGVPTGSAHQWYAGTSEIMTLRPNGTLSLDGNLDIGSNAFLDDDPDGGGVNDDWIRFSSYVEMRSADPNIGLVLRDTDDSNYLCLTQRDGASYFSDSTAADGYFLRGDGNGIHVPGIASLGHIRLSDNGYLDDDDTPGGGVSDDWLRLNGYVEMKSATADLGIVLRENDSNDYLSMTQKDGKSYFADTNNSAVPFLIGDGNSVTVPGALKTNDWLIATQPGKGLHFDDSDLSLYADSTQDLVFETNGGGASIKMKTTGGHVRGYFHASVANEVGTLDQNRRWLFLSRRSHSGTRYAVYDGDSNIDYVSDRRLKTAIKNEENVLARVMKLDVVNYHFKDETPADTEIGLIAQDVEEHFPSLVSERDDPIHDFKVKALGYTTFGVIALGAIKELKQEKDAEIAALKNENAKLREQLESKDRDLETRLSLLESKLLGTDKEVAVTISK